MIITTAMLTPFMVAMAPETPAQQPAAPAAVYNWENQGEMNILDENDKIGAGGWGSFSSGRPGDPQQVDDWHLC